MRCKGVSQKGKEPPQLAAHRGVKPRTYHLRKRDKHGGAEDKDWRAAVFVRDEYRCQSCGQIGGRLQAHHVRAYADFPDLRHEVSNGVTLCVECHRATDTFGWQKYHAVKRLAQEVLPLEMAEPEPTQGDMLEARP